MVLDMTYAQVSKVIPLQDANAVAASGNTVCDEFFELLRKQGKTFSEHKKSFVHEPGKRYIGVIQTASNLNHAVAIDEFGVVFDPEASLSESRKSWTEYEFIGLLGVFTDSDKE